MVFTSTASSAAKSNWMRVAISLIFLSASLCAEGPVIDFFLKSETNEEKQDEKSPIEDFFIKDKTKKISPKKKTPIRDFFFKNSDKERDTDSDLVKGCDCDDCIHPSCPTHECEDCSESYDATCECDERSEPCSEACECCN